MFVIKNRIVDTKSLGVKGDIKIAIQELRDTDGLGYMRFQLYSRKRNTWRLTQKEKLEIVSLASLDPKFIDFNNDGYKDLTVRSGEAARGANEIRTLYIFNKTSEKLIKVRNSENYPNLEFNKELNCIDAWLVYGGSSTVFLKLEADTLREFAAVHLNKIERSVELIGKNGEKRVIRKDKIRETDVYTRYSNYNPLKINKKLEY